MNKTEKIKDSPKDVHEIKSQCEDDSERDEQQNQRERDIKDDSCITEELSVYTKFHGHTISKGYDEEKIKIGLRVVRPHNMEHESDNTEIGTIVSISKSGDIQVQWDKTGKYDTIKINNCNMYELLLFDNAQTGVKHTFLQCNGCKECPLRGIRWKCMKCNKYNLCSKCYMNGKHPSSHIFKRILSTNSKGVQMSPRENLCKTSAYGIIPFANVQLRRKPKIEGLPVNYHDYGQVQQFIDTKINMFRSDAQVKWTDNSKGQYCVGRDGKCELKFTNSANGLRFYAHHLPNVTNENTQKGARVVNFSKDESDGQDDQPELVGTVTKIGHMDTQVKWDNGRTDTYQLKNTNLLLLDNGPLGIQHKDYFCDGCQKGNTGTIRGIRWSCMECDHVDLCTKCYMADLSDNADMADMSDMSDMSEEICNVCNEHKFRRFVSDDKGEDMTVARNDRTLRKQSVGIFKSAIVDETTGDTAKKHGKVVQICNYDLDAVRSEVEVKWTDDEKPSCHPILDCKLLNGGKIVFYHDHLPILRTGCHGYFDVDFDLKDGCKKKIQVDIWRTIERNRKLTYKPTLYLIFANHPEVDKAGGKMALMEEVIDFAKKTKLPCHVLEQKVLFYSGSTNTVFIHQKTDTKTIEKLVNKGFHKFRRGDASNKEDEICYFIRMAEYVLGETILPVIISLTNGGMTTAVLKLVEDSKIPIVRLKKNSLDVKVLTPQNMTDQFIEMIEHRTDSKNPWKIKESKKRKYKLNTKTKQDNQDEISLISEIQFGFRNNLDDLVCFLVIGVSMEGTSLGKMECGTYGDIYPNALSMYLLKEGKWRIPKEHVKKSFSYISLEYIYEEDMKSEIKSKDGLWSQLKFKTGMAYKTPGFMYKVNRKSENIRSEGATYMGLDTAPDTCTIELQPKTASSKSDDERSERAMEGCLDKTYSLENGNDIKLNVSTSELYGLILFALLQKKYYSGAQQLIETGCIRIHDILIGCAILENEANNWKTTPSMKEQLQRLKTAFTQRAIRITLCVYEADKNKLKIDIKQREENDVKHQDDSEDKENKELGDYINHAGRLLLHHGYLENAIKTENKTFIDHDTVKDILSTMWYDKEEFDFPTTLLFFFLAVFHVIVMPLLMINMEAPPLLWFYKKYKLPFMKVFMHMLGFLVLLSAYSYMLLFNYSEDGITYTDYFIIAWMASFFIDESKQSIVAIVRGKWSSYAKSNWNRIDWLSMIAYTSGMLSKLGDGSHYRNASSVLLVSAFILLCIRILNWFCISSVLGPTLVMIQEMFLDTFAFMTIMTVIMMCYNISYYALLYPNSEFTWSQIENIIQNGYWMLFGELNLDGDKLTEPDCSFNRTIYESGVLQQCPSQLGVYLTPYLKAFYGLIAVILLLNLLIAMYSNTYDNVHQESRFHWSQLQTDFLEEYSIKTIFPIHLQLLVLPATIIHAILWFSRSHISAKCKGKNNAKKDEATLNSSPMFVRVFLYNTNFDLKLKATREAEGAAALEAKGIIDFMKVDSFMQEQHDNDKTHGLITKISTKQEIMDKSLTEMKQLILTKQEDMENKLNEIQNLLSTIANSEEKKDKTVPESLSLHAQNSDGNCKVTDL